LVDSAADITSGLLEVTLGLQVGVAGGSADSRLDAAGNVVSDTLGLTPSLLGLSLGGIGGRAGVSPGLLGSAYSQCQLNEDFLVSR
jgi:hypothetical protein